MLIHLPRGNKFTSAADAKVYILNHLIQHIGKQEGIKVAEPMGKKTRKQLIKLLDKYINNTPKKNNIKKKRTKKTK